MNHTQNNKHAWLGWNKASRVGSWTLAMTLIVLAVLVVVNLLVGALPSTFTRLDLTTSKRYTTSATTEKYIKGVDRDVHIYCVLRDDMDPALQTLLDRYTSLNSRIRVSTVDPVADPGFLDTHSALTTSGNYLVVESALRYTAINISELEYIYVNALNKSYSIEEYAQIIADETLIYYYAQQGIDLKDYTAYFAGEQQLTAAIEYVTLDTIPHIYVLAGNGEGELSGNIKELMDLAMMDYELLTLEGDAAVPEDAAIIIINAPSFDLSASATAALSDYLAAGGRLLVTTSPDNVTMPNLMSLMSQMGATPTNGMIHEGNANKYVGSPTTLKPTPNTNHIIPYNVAYQNMSIVMPRCHGIVISETLPENVKATTLLSASDAYTVAADGSETDYGAVATGVELTNSKTGASIIWYSSVDAFSDSTAAAHGQAGTYYFAISASQLNPGYTSQILSSIEAVDVTTQPLNVSALTCMILGAVLALGIPAVIVVGGVIVWARRRKN